MEPFHTFDSFIMATRSTKALWPGKWEEIPTHFRYIQGRREQGLLLVDHHIKHKEVQMQSFKSYQAEQEEILVEATAGHKYQTELADKILNALTPQQRDNITIKVAPPSSTLPDIKIIHKIIS